MRNEGPFLLEWVAYHRAIGFQDIVIVTNACTDGSDDMLDELAAMGCVTHIRNDAVGTTAPQLSGLPQALKHEAVAQKDWVLQCDADEFMNLTSGDASVGPYLQRFDHADVIALLWRSFGDNHIKYWRGGSVLRSFIRTDPRPLRRQLLHKSMFRPDKFGSAIDHMPKEPRDASVTVVGGAGQKISNDRLFDPKAARYRVRPYQCTWEGACINHYAIRSQDVFLMKNLRGDGMGRTHGKYYLQSVFHRRNNRNTVEDRGILDKIDATEAILSDMMQSKTLRQLDRRALECFLDARDTHLTKERIATWTHAA